MERSIYMDVEIMTELFQLPQPFFHLIGVAGFILYMLAYGLLQSGRISGQS